MRVMARVESREEERSLECVGNVREVMGEVWWRREPSSLEVVVIGETVCGGNCFPLVWGILRVGRSVREVIELET